MFTITPSHHPGSYRFVCRLGGHPTWTHWPCGPILHIVTAAERDAQRECARDIVV